MGSPTGSLGPVRRLVTAAVALVATVGLATACGSGDDDGAA